MANDVTRKEFDALVKKVNSNFSDSEKLQKADDTKFTTLVDTTNKAIKTLNEADQIVTDNLNKAIKGFNDNDAGLDKRIKALEKK